MTHFFKSPILVAILSACLLLPGSLIASAPDSAADGSSGPGDASSSIPGAPALAADSGAPVDTSRSVVNGDDHILRPGDLIEVKVFQEPDLDSYVRVAKDGAILFPLIDRVTVGGLTPLDAANLIQRLLDKDYLVNPQVALRVIDYSERTFTVLGEVQKPGAFDMPDRTNVSLLQAIGMAGGYTRMANPSSVTVKRKVKDAETIFRLNAKKMATASGPNSFFEIQPDDVITVSESIF